MSEKEKPDSAGEAHVLLPKFRGALVGAVLGDCIGGEFEGTSDVSLEAVLQHLSKLEDETWGDEALKYTDDTAMTRCVADSLLTRAEFDAQDMARRFAKEYNHAPGRGYGAHVQVVLRKLASPRLGDVYEPARSQFRGSGSFGNGGAKRAAPFALAFRRPSDVRKFSRLGAMLTHSCSLGYNGAILHARAVHLSLHGGLALPSEFINRLISEMKQVEKEEEAQREAPVQHSAELPYCTRLQKVKDLLEKNSVSVEEVISELGNDNYALKSVPTAIFCFLRCLEPTEGLPERFGGLERTIAYSLTLGGDTDSIASMAGAIAGAHYGIESIPQSWQNSCEGVKEADFLAKRMYNLYTATQNHKRDNDLQE